MPCKHDKTCCKNFEPVEESESESEFRKAARNDMNCPTMPWADILRARPNAIRRYRITWNTAIEMVSVKMSLAGYHEIPKEITDLKEPE